MFVRRKPNKTGTTSIHVVSKQCGKYKFIRSFGTGRTELELQFLENKARQFIQEQKGQTISLFESAEDVFLEDFISTLSNSQLQVIGPELIFGRLYDKIGFNAIEEDLFRHLVISRLFNPGSKLKTIDYLHRYQGICYSSDTLYRFLDTLCFKQGSKKSKDIKSEVEKISFEHSKAVLKNKLGVVFYDMTTLYFEASDEDDLRKTGFSKDGKHHCPQIYLGLLVAAEGNPIGYEIFEGNIFEGNTFIPALEKIESKYSLGKPIIVADSGLLSNKNIQLMQEKGYKYILGARIKSESQDIKQQILSLELKNGETAIIKKDKNTRIIISMSDNRAVKDAHNRERGLIRLQKQLGRGKLTKANINNRGYNKYLRLEGDVNITIDMQKYQADSKWDGLKGYQTNTKLSAKNIIINYSNLWYIERAFRMNKTDLRIRPIYHRLRNRIEGHICICFTAYTIMLEMERMLKKAKSKITITRAQELTRNMYQLTYQLPNSKKTIQKILNMDNEQKELFKIVQN
ncbi:IS1634 family transposase, partial [Bacteroidales bacterium OttesenSCG-928-L14]|nr:IS1634 family transposase [Bacteroidales bacterium OttesenSCG-928-L14]